MKAAVKGIGWVTAGGMGFTGNHTGFAPGSGAIPRIRRKDVFDTPETRFGRMDDYSRLGIAALAFCLRDAGMEAWNRKRPVGIIAQTINGCLNTDIDFYKTVMPDKGAFAGPNLFAYTLPNTFLGNAAIRFGLTGPAYAVSPSDKNELESIIMGIETIAWNEAECIICGVCDLLPNDDELKIGAMTKIGAIFCVIASPETGNENNYGILQTDGMKTMLFNETPIRRIDEIVLICLKQYESGKN